MAEHTEISWADATFNPWFGCTKVSPACDHCYAEGWAKRSGLVKWGDHPRRRASEASWKQPVKWNRQAEDAGIRRKVFCASLADVFDNQVPTEWRAALFALIDATPSLDWLLLTKRPQNIAKMMPEVGIAVPRPNVWLGTTVENQEEANRRIPHLLKVPAVLHFLSCEPLLGPLQLDCMPTTALRPHWRFEPGTYNALTGSWWAAVGDPHYESSTADQDLPRIGWVIGGGESGTAARPPRIEWVRALRDQCAAAQVPFHWKQWGEFTPDDPAANRTSMRRVGKKAAGRLLDGREHNALPWQAEAGGASDLVPLVLLGPLKQEARSFRSE